MNELIAEYPWLARVATPQTTVSDVMATMAFILGMKGVLRMRASVIVASDIRPGFWERLRRAICYAIWGRFE